MQFANAASSLVLHRRAHLIEVREEEHYAAPGHDHAQRDHAAPEPDLFPGIEPARRHVLGVVRVDELAIRSRSSISSAN